VGSIKPQRITLLSIGKREFAGICWQIRRNTGDVANNYNANARLFEFDIHHQISKLGTITEIPT
jgi:glutathione synthase/RimK-type ligase-like ATP-grasp enzyme